MGNIPGDKIRWLVDDCAKFVEREIRRGNTYDGIIMDPPSYGRGPKGEIWKIEESIFPFIELTSKVLSKDPVFFLINSYTTGLQPAVLSYMLNTVLTKKLGGVLLRMKSDYRSQDPGWFCHAVPAADGVWTHNLDSDIF